MAALHISISAEKVAQIGPLVISNSILTSLIVSAIIVALCFYTNRTLKEKGKFGRFQMLMEMLIEMLYQLCMDITESTKKSMKFAPLIISFFLFILLNNWLGLLPGVGTIGFRKGHELNAKIPSVVQQVQAKTVTPTITEQSKENPTEKVETTSEEEKGEFVPYFRAGTADLNTTLALAIISVFFIQYFGVKSLGLSYFSKFFTIKNPILTFVGLLEFILEFAKVMSFAFRLFGNIFAGEVLLAVMTFLIPVIVPMPFYGLEIFVGVIQAFVFAMLSLVFFNLATVGHGEEH